jgi:flagellar motor switch protein FliN/FliY
MSAEPINRVERYWQGWISSLALLLSQMAATDWQVESSAVAESHAVDCLRVRAEGGLSGQQWLSFAAADIKALLDTFLGEEVTVQGELDQTQQEAIEELVRQWSGLAASALKADFGEVTLRVELESSPDHAGSMSKLLRAMADARLITVVLELDSKLVNELNPSAAAIEMGTESNPPESPGVDPAPSVMPSARTLARIEELLRQGNFELLMDVELPVMLRFGSRQATLRDVLELATGAVLELDREIREPVDLVLHEKVIARGEVVVVDGNYGLRVLEVGSPQQRVSSL